MAPRNARVDPRRGLSLIELLVVVALLGLLVGLSLAGVQRARAAAARTRCQNNLRQVALALHGWHNSRQTLPPGFTSPGGSDRYRELAWQARLLPYLEQQPLWAQAEAAYSADSSGAFSPPHRAVMATVLPVFGCPDDPRSAAAQDYRGLTVGLCSYMGNAGLYYARSTGVLYADSTIRFVEITDGTSQTLMVGERPPSSDNRFGWWYRGVGQRYDGSLDFFLGVRERNAFDDYDCPPGPYRFELGSPTNQCDAFHFWSLHSGGANFAFADGSVRFLNYSADPIMPALASRAGGEVVELP